MSDYIPTIGLEIHTELKTKTKMFCGCLNNPDEKQPNKNICPVCTGQPGALPTINKEAVEKVLKLGLAVGSNILRESKFDRKNYFYPDLPKAYQISQYDKPLVYGGVLNGVRLTRIHLEEDTARLLHELPANVVKDSESNLGRQTKQASFVDFNRASIPLMELVTEPDIKDGEEAMKFAKELQLVLRYLDLSDADMEKGHMRIEANVSVRKSEELGTKVEVKNINSFKAVGDAINYEIKRQAEILDRGERVVQETRGWDEKKKATVSQRLKESAHDYRYFPDPDLPPLDLDSSAGEFDLKKLENELPELPWQKRERFMKEYELTEEQVSLLVEDKDLSGYFEEIASEYKAFKLDSGYQLLYNYCITNLKGMMNEKGISIKEIKVTPEHFAYLVSLVATGKITSNMAKEVLREMFEKGADPEEIIEEKGFNEEVGEDMLNNIIAEVISENEKAADDFRKGNENVLQFLVGQAMKKLKGRGNPQILRNKFKEKI